jgi:hypothetical protein
MRVDEITSPPPTTSPLDAVKARDGHEAAQRHDVSRSAPAEPEVHPHDDQPDSHPVPEDVPDEVLGLPAQHARVRREEDDESRSGLPEQPQPVRKAGQRGSSILTGQGSLGAPE